MKKALLVSVLFLSVFTFGQNVGINTTGTNPDASAMLDIMSSTKGLLIPRVDIINVNTAAPITAPTTSLLVYNTNVASGVGYYYWDGSKWNRIYDETVNAEDHDWYKETTTSAPSAITDDIFTEGTVRIKTPNYVPLEAERTHVTTNSVLGVIQLHGTSTGNMADNFGARIDFNIEDNAGVSNEIAHIGAVRDGADDSGKIQFWTEEAGVDGVKMVIQPDGNVGIGTNTPNSELTVNGVIEVSKVGNTSTIYFPASSSDPGYIRHTEVANSSEMRFVSSDDFDANSAIDIFTFGGETAGVFTEVMRIRGDKKVGIGVSNPLETLDINGDINMRGDDLYFSHDGGSNANNDYFNYNDLSLSATLGGVGVVSFHADVARGQAWNVPTASISFDGAYVTGKIGLNTQTPEASLDIVNGYAVTDRFWYKDYLNLSTINSATIVGRDGNPLPPNFVGMFYCVVTGTNASGSSYWMVKRQSNGTIHIEKIASFGSTTSNTPEIFNNGGVISIRLYNHGGPYNVRIRTEQMW